MLLQEKIALVYGAGGAVGGAVARAFAREGARVILAGRTATRLEKVAREIHGDGGWAAVAPVDALDAAAVERHLAGVLQQTGPVKVMFNAIDWGDVQGQALVEMRPEDFASVVERAVETWFLTGTATARQMIAHGGGTIVGITANAGRTPIPMVGGFGVACAAVEQFLRQLAVETGPSGVRVCFVRSAGSPEAPGLAEIFQKFATDRGISLQEVLDEMSAGIPLRRMPSLAEVANAAVLLASDLATGMTATVANVTCGALVD